MFGNCDFIQRVGLLDRANLIGLYRLDEPSGDSIDYSLLGNNGSWGGDETRRSYDSPDGRKVVETAQPGNNSLDIYSSDFNSNFNGNEFSLFFLYRTDTAGRWTDNNNLYLCMFYVDSSNRILIKKDNGNTMDIIHIGGGTNRTINGTRHDDANWHTLLVRYQIGVGNFQVYSDGVLADSQNSGGTYSGSLDSTQTCLFAQNSSTGINEWVGGIACAAIWKTFISDAIRDALIHNGRLV